MISEWIEDSRVLLHAHFSIADSIRKKHKRLGIPSALLSAIASTGIFSTIGNSPDVYIQVTIGMLSLVASVLSTLNAFLNYSEVSAKHQKTAVNMASIRKELEELLVFPPCDNADLKESIKEIRKRWDKIREEAIPVSSDKLNEYRRKILAQKKIDV